MVSQTMRHVGLATLTLAVCALAGAAGAEPKRVVVVSAGDDAVEVARARGLEIADDRAVRRDRAAWKKRARIARERSLAAVTGALARAQDLYLEQEFAEMTEALERAERDHRLLLADPAHRDLAWAVAFRLGLAQLSSGDRDAAARRFALALALSPERRPAADLYGPDVASAFSQAVAERERLAPRPVAIRTEPAGALVAIDGGAALGARRNLRPGPHWIRASAPGYLSRAEIVDVDDSGAVSIELSADDGSGAVDAWDAGSLGPGRPAFDAYWRTVLSESGADAVVWVGASRAAVVTADRVMSATGASARAAASAALDAWLGAPRLAVDGGGDRSLFREPLFWGGVAAVVALGVAGVLVLRSDDGAGGGGGIEVGVVDP